MNTKQNSSLVDRIRNALFEEDVSADNPMTEQMLAERFGVSRSPIRDALKELEKEGLVERRKNKGVYLKPLTIQEMMAICDARAALEGFATMLAAERAEASDFSYLKKLARQFRDFRRKGNHKRAEEADRAFHEKIVELSGNPILGNILDRFRILRRAFRMRCLDPVVQQKVSIAYSHEKIVSIMQRRNPDGCEKAMRLHIERTKRILTEQALGMKLNRFGEGGEK